MVDGWLTIQQAAKEIGVGPATIRTQIRRGKLASRKIGGSAKRGGMHLLKKADVEEYRLTRSGKSGNMKYRSEIRQVLRDLDLEQERPGEVSERDWGFLVAHLKGATYREIADQYEQENEGQGITTERVRQLLVQAAERLLTAPGVTWVEREDRA